MGKIFITTDSGMDSINTDTMIPAQIIENNEICYRDVVEISSNEILKRMKEGSIFKTSSPLISDYQEKFTSLSKGGNDIIHLSMSSGISEGSVNSAHLAASTVMNRFGNRIKVIDTFTGATGGTLIERLACDYVKQGFPVKNVVDFLEEIKRRVYTSFYVPNPEGFIRSGRNKSEMCLKEHAKLMGVKTALMAGIKFRVDFNHEGNLYTNGILRCKVESGMLKIVKNIVNKENMKLYESKYVVVGNVCEKSVDMQEVISYLQSLNYFENIINQGINGVVAAYGSDDLCGISLVKK